MQFSHISTFFSFQFKEEKILETFDYFEDTKKINYFEFLASTSKTYDMSCKSNDDS